jgi:hypothetical protein
MTMNPLMTVLGVLLAVSVAGNVLVGNAWLETRDRANLAERARDTAASAAGACSRGVLLTREAGQKQAKDAEALIAAARADGVEAGRRAAWERFRQQAVPGDACASAQVETDDWLKRRQGVTNGR